MTTPHDSIPLSAFVNERLKREAERSLYQFVRFIWPILNPGQPFIDGRHIRLVCEYLEAVTAGELTRLVINLPPRHMKSLLGAVAWPIWEWLQMPGQRWLFVSHSELLAQTHSLLRRRVLRSDLLQGLWGDSLRLMSDQAAKMEFHNVHGGVMTARPIGGSVTGKGGDRLVIDDPHSPEEAERDHQRQRTVELFAHTLLTRLDSKKHGAAVVMQQRLNVDDLTGRCLELGFTPLILPALVDRQTTVVFPRSKQRWVRKPGTPLWPAREDREQLELLRRALGSYAFAGQYLQQPYPKTGGLFSPEWWGWYDEVPQADGQIVLSWDASFKDGPSSDPVCCLVGCRRGSQIYLIDGLNRQMSFTDTVRAMEAMHERYPMADATVIELAANAFAIVNHLEGKIPRLHGVPPQGGKRARAVAVQPWVEAGQVMLPRVRTEAGEYRSQYCWAEDLVAQCTAFPNAPHDDFVDALSQLLLWFQQHPHVEPAGELFDTDHPVKLRHPIMRRRQIRMFHRPSRWDWDRWYDPEDDESP